MSEEESSDTVTIPRKQLEAYTRLVRASYELTGYAQWVKGDLMSSKDWRIRAISQVLSDVSFFTATFEGIRPVFDQLEAGKVEGVFRKEFPARWRTEEEIEARGGPRILCAAIHIKTNSTYKEQPRNIKSGLVICGRRHHNCFLTAFALYNGDTSYYNDDTVVQGFITSDDRFVNRKEAFEIAVKADQLIYSRSQPGSILISEDLY